MQFLLACGFEDKVISVEGEFKRRRFSPKLVCNSESGVFLVPFSLLLRLSQSLNFLAEPTVRSILRIMES